MTKLQEMVHLANEVKSEVRNTLYPLIEMYDMILNDEELAKLFGEKCEGSVSFILKLETARKYIVNI